MTTGADSVLWCGEGFIGNEPRFLEDFKDKTDPPIKVSHKLLILNSLGVSIGV
jgi:hypothetical protein